MTTVTVGELIQELSKYPKTFPVQIRFCIMVEDEVPFSSDINIRTMTTDCDLELEDIEATPDKVYLLTSNQEG